MKQYISTQLITPLLAAMYPGSVYYAIKHQSNDNLLDMGVSLAVYENNTSVRTITTITLLTTLFFYNQLFTSPAHGSRTGKKSEKKSGLTFAHQKSTFEKSE
jgi:hypothetical protein